MFSDNKRLNILRMIDDEIITTEEALKLLDALNVGERSTEFQMQESMFCIPGGKCYTLDEVKNLEQHTIPEFHMNRELENAASKTDRKDQQSN